MNRGEQDAHEDLCRRLVTALNERDAARAEVAAWLDRWPLDHSRFPTLQQAGAELRGIVEGGTA